MKKNKNMETIKCPVCGNPGISDYKKEDVICPHCGSDLTIYHTVLEIAEANAFSKNNINKYKTMSIILTIVSTMVAIGTTCILYSNSKTLHANVDIIEAKEKNISIMRDSVSVLNAQIQELTTTRSNYVNYIVVQNDGPWRIIDKIYGTRVDWEDVAQKIAQDNNIESLKKIHPGQVLKINRNY